MPGPRSSGKISRLYADENVAFGILCKLRLLGHDVRHIRQDCKNKRGDGLPDPVVFAEAQRTDRIVLTHNLADFLVIHAEKPGHRGVIVCAVDEDHARLAKVIDKLIRNVDVRSKLVRINIQNRTQPWRIS